MAKRSAMATFPSIPQEILEENILTRLPVKSISRFRCVCKHWYNDLFQSPRFIEMHLQHAIVMNRFNLLVSDSQPYDAYGLYSIDHNVLSTLPSVASGECDAIEIEFPFRSEILNTTPIHGSCNGLVCIESDDGDICIWNPSTKEYKQVPKTPIKFPSKEVAEEEEYYECEEDENEYETSYGFGYDRKTDDYRLLRIVGCEYKHVSEVRVYTLRSNSWKSLGSIPYNFYGLNISAGCLVDGVLHWVAETEFKSLVVVSFDICNETFCDTPLPDSNRLNLLKLGKWEGKLCLVHKRTKDDAVVWVMKGNAWSKQTNITDKVSDIVYRKPIQTLQNGEILVKGFLLTEHGRICVVSYDPNLERARVLKIHGLTGVGYWMEPYIETLVSLNSGTFVGQE